MGNLDLAFSFISVPFDVNPEVLYAFGEGDIEEENVFGFPPNEYAGDFSLVDSLILGSKNKTRTRLLFLLQKLYFQK